MAMFEIDDSEDVKLTRCKTDTETLVKGKGLHRLDAEDCEVAQNSNPTEKRKALKVIGWVMTIVAMVIAAYLTKLFGLV
jgi:uncharacterized protein YcgI (DUF1989 family)